MHTGGTWKMKVGRIQFGGRRVRALCIGACAMAMASCAQGPAWQAGRHNLALNKPASCSSLENDEHHAGKANDGDPNSYWCADDEPEVGPEWWQVDLQRRADLSACEICWSYDGKNYRYRIEGSVEGKLWTLLSDQ